jgi:hypothetical protein
LAVPSKMLQIKKNILFVEIIRYDGTSLDALEIFIRSGMTDYTGATETGTGKIGASFREESREKVIELDHELEEKGIKVHSRALAGWLIIKDYSIIKSFRIGFDRLLLKSINPCPIG